MGEMIEGGSVGVVELEGSDGDGAIADGGLVGAGLDVFDYFLLGEPVVAAPARVFAGAEDVARDFGGLAGKLNPAGPVVRDVDVEQDARRKAFLDDERGETAGELRGGAKIEFAAAMRNGNGDGRNVVDRGFHGGADRAGVIDIFAEIAAAIDAGDNEVGLVFEKSVESENHGVGGGAFDGIFAGGDLVAIDGLAESERLCGGAAFVRGSDDGQSGVIFESVHESAEAGGVDAVVVGDENVRHGIALPGPNHRKTQEFLELPEIGVAVQQGMTAQDAKGGDQAINGFANRAAFATQRSKILRRGNRDLFSAGIKQLEFQKVRADHVKLTIAGYALQDLAENQVSQAESCAASFTIEPIGFGVARAPQVIHPDGRVHDHHRRAA